MTGRNGKELLGAWVPSNLAAQFRTLARATDGGPSAALRRMMGEAVGEAAPGPALVSSGYRVTVRLKDAERQALLDAAEARATSPANWIRSLAVVHLARKPQWSAAEIEALRSVFEELGRIGNNVNQIARVLNIAAQDGEYPPEQGQVAEAAAEMVRAEMRRLGAILTGNFDYWGLPDAERPTAQAGAKKREKAAAREAGQRDRLRPKARPGRFAAIETPA